MQYESEVTVTGQFLQNEMKTQNFSLFCCISMIYLNHNSICKSGELNLNTIGNPLIDQMLTGIRKIVVRNNIHDFAQFASPPRMHE